MRLRLFAAALAAACVSLGASSARATATLTCEIKDRAFEFALQGAVGSIASSISGLQGEIDMKAAGVEPARKIEFDAESLRQQWIEGADLKLWLRTEKTDKTPELDLIVETKRKSKTSGDYAGTFRLTVEGAKGPRKVAGKASCSMD